MNLNRILLIVALLMAVSALAVSLDGRFRPLPGTAHAKHSSSADSACGCGNPAKKQEGGCGAGCCGGGGKSSGGCATGLNATSKTVKK
jgi:hypothetical protein